MNLSINNYDNNSPNFGSVFVKIPTSGEDPTNMAKLVKEVATDFAKRYKIDYDVCDIMHGVHQKVLKLGGSKLRKTKGAIPDNSKDPNFANALIAKGLDAWY